jgi:hypothetical protein
LQAQILKGSYFAGAIGNTVRPIGFRLHGYEPVDLIPTGITDSKPGEIPVEVVGSHEQLHFHDAKYF